MTKAEVFQNGTYHNAQAKEMQNPVMIEKKALHLFTAYTDAWKIITTLGWEQPLERRVPQVLQMGIAGFHTASFFSQFIFEHNPNAQIIVADTSPIPLQECKERGLLANPNISLNEADTTALPFPDQSFDLIETDGLLQFLDPAAKRAAVAEWHRVLTPNGVVTTRDRFVSMHDHPSAWDTLNYVRKQFNSKYGVETYPSTTEVMRYTFNHQGFETYINPEGTFCRSRVLIHDIVARKK